MLTAIVLAVAIYAVLLAFFGFFAFVYTKDNAEFMEVFLPVAKYLGIGIFGASALGILSAMGQ